jgi:ribose/xylose/arabinose/galactoside ABC-type transport system permease subunit
MISAFIALLINRGRLGSEILAVGGNPQASHLSGLAVHRSVISVYVIGSVLAAFSGCLISAYIGLASIGVGGPYTLNSVASTVIGGTPFSGGEGTVAGTFGGALIMIILNAILTTLNTGEAGKLVVQGMTIILMVGIYQRRAREQR